MLYIPQKMLAFAISTSALTSPLFAQAASTLTEAMQASKTQLHWRTRVEQVDQDGLAEKATASTIKTRITYTSGTYQGFGYTLEMEDVSNLGEVDYSDGLVNRGTPIIADPEVTEINQSALSYTYKTTTAKYGRQRIVLDNQRFVGGVGFRQDEQTFDGFTVTSKPVPALSLFYGYITDVNRIFGEAKAVPGKPNGDHNHESHLLNAKYDFPFGSLIGYGYLLEDKSIVDWSSDTMGLRWQGKAGAYLTYNLEYASQKNSGDSTLDYNADYNLVEIIGSLPIGKSKLNLTGAMEILGSDNGKQGFQTYLATLHIFQGWADKFLVTPVGGMNDAYAAINYVHPKFTLGTVYHTYSQNEGDFDYGDELGFVAEIKVGPTILTLKYADFSSRDEIAGYPDTSKLWLTAAVTF
jgi:hypothetical protein